MDPSLPESVHGGLSADTLHFCTRAATHMLSKLPDIDRSGQIHHPGVNLEDVESGLLFFQRSQYSNTPEEDIINTIFDIIGKHQPLSWGNAKRV